MHLRENGLWLDDRLSLVSLVIILQNIIIFTVVHYVRILLELLKVLKQNFATGLVLPLASLSTLDHVLDFVKTVYS